MYKMNEVSVVFISDENYIINTSVAITSLYINKRAGVIYNVYLIVDNIENAKMNKLKELSDENFRIHIIDYKRSVELEDLGIRDTAVSVSATIKFYLADILYDLDKVIYLDGDVIVQGDLCDLYNMDVEDRYAIVVRDYIAEKMTPNAMQKLKSDHKYYFNSGMMVLNLRKMRKEKIGEKLVQYRKNGINYFMDQDALNVVFDENVKYVSCKYNYMITLFDFFGCKRIGEMCNVDATKLECERIMEAQILHLTGREKPLKVWMPVSSEIFMKYYDKSPFADENIFQPVAGNMNFQEQYLFPFELINKKERIILWGAGKVGTQYYNQVKCSGYCDIIAWVDQNWKSYKNEAVSSPENIAKLKADHIVIAIKQSVHVEKVVEQLGSMGIDSNKIVWRYPSVAT